MRIRSMLLSAALFYVFASSLLFATTVSHEYSHYAAHEGIELPPITFKTTPQDAHTDMVIIESMKIAGKNYRVENVEESTIVLHQDLFLYALTLNLAPTNLYNDGTLAATYLQTTPTTLQAEPNDVNAAPVYTAATMFLIAIALYLLKQMTLTRSLLYATTSEISNNAHHAIEMGINATLYTIIAQLLFTATILLLLAPTFRRLLPKAPRVAAFATTKPHFIHVKA